MTCCTSEFTLIWAGGWTTSFLMSLPTWVIPWMNRNTIIFSFHNWEVRDWTVLICKVYSSQSFSISINKYWVCRGRIEEKREIYLLNWWCLHLDHKQVFYLRAGAHTLQFLEDKLFPVRLFTGCIPSSIVFNVSLIVLTEIPYVLI